MTKEELEQKLGHYAYLIAKKQMDLRNLKCPCKEVSKEIQAMQIIANGVTTEIEQLNGK